jgi:epoxyqueuosine reductase
MSSLNSEQIKNWARQIGFDLVGITSARPSDYRQHYHHYLQKGYAGEMPYLSRNVEKRLDPKKLVPGAESIICVAINYYTGDHPCGTDPIGRVARYAWGRDYHVVLKERLKTLADKVHDVDHNVFVWRFVDTAPLAEREYAQRAGLGWVGKNGLLINKRLGSWLLLGQLVTDLKLDYDSPASDHCGSCRSCLDACPTQAFVGPHVLDPRKCISYLTIESRKEIPSELAPKTGNWIFGCDVCQEVCPFNRRAPVTDDADFQPRDRKTLPLEQAQHFDDETFGQRFADSSMDRTTPQQMARAAQNALNNQEKDP